MSKSEICSSKYNEFGINLKKARTALGLTQSQFADRLNLSPSTIGMYEQGRREPDIKLLKNVCVTLNISSDELLDINISNIIKTAEIDKIIRYMIEYIKNQDNIIFNNIELSQEKIECVIFLLEQIIK